MNSFLEYLTEVKSMTDAMKSSLKDNSFNHDAMKKSMKLISGLSTAQKEMFDDRFSINLDAELKLMTTAMKSLSRCKLHTLK